MWLPIVGGFVWTHDRLGIGKLVSHDGLEGEVEFNHSAVRTEKQTYPLVSLRWAYLPLQTRVYRHRGNEWLLGRVLGRHALGTVALDRRRRYGPQPRAQRAARGRVSTRQLAGAAEGPEFAGGISF